MKRTLLLIVSMTIVIGILGLSFNNAFGNQTIIFIQKQQVNMLNTHWYIWKFDFWSYIENIQLSISNISKLKFEMPSREWDWMDNVFDGTALTNDLALMLDYVIMILNLLLYPLRVGAYMLENLMALLGINTDVNNINNGMAWLVKFVQDILLRIAIPYI